MRCWELENAALAKTSDELREVGVQITGDEVAVSKPHDISVEFVEEEEDVV